MEDAGSKNMAAARAWASRRREAIEAAEAARAERRAEREKAEREATAAECRVEAGDSLLRRSWTGPPASKQQNDARDEGSAGHVHVWDGRFDTPDDDDLTDGGFSGGSRMLPWEREIQQQIQQEETEKAALGAEEQPCGRRDFLVHSSSNKGPVLRRHGTVQHGRRAASNATHAPTSSSSSGSGDAGGGGGSVIDGGTSARIIDDFVRSSVDMDQRRRQQGLAHTESADSHELSTSREEVTQSSSSVCHDEVSSRFTGDARDGPRKPRRRWTNAGASESPLHAAARLPRRKQQPPAPSTASTAPVDAGGKGRSESGGRSPDTVMSGSSSAASRPARRELMPSVAYRGAEHVRSSTSTSSSSSSTAASRGDWHGQQYNELPKTTATRIMALLKECDERTARENDEDSRANKGAVKPARRRPRPLSSPPKFMIADATRLPPAPVPIIASDRQRPNNRDAQGAVTNQRSSSAAAVALKKKAPPSSSSSLYPPKSEVDKVWPLQQDFASNRPRQIAPPASKKMTKNASKQLAPQKPQLVQGDVVLKASSSAAGGGDDRQPWRKQRPQRPEDVVTRQMFDKRHSRRNFSEPFQAAIARWRDAHAHAGMRGPSSRPTSTNVRVFLRKRPLFQHEQARGEYDCITVPDNGPDGGICGGGSSSREVVVHNCQMHADLKRMYIKHQSFAVSGAFNELADNEAVFEHAASGVVRSACDGGTAALFMYGQTGSGKTYTMGSIEREAAEFVFERQNVDSVFLSYFEISGKRCVDLLDSCSGQKEIQLKEVAGDSVELIGACCEAVTGADHLMRVLEQGKSRRATSSTFCNASSSRSHAVAKLGIVLVDGRVGTLMLIDCAGSERKEDNMYHNAEQRRETAEINTSLYALKECMRMRAMQNSARGGGGHVHVPYRSSQLTRVLMECFVRPDSHIAVIGTVSPSASDIEHSVSTLKTVQLIGGGELSDEGTLEEREEVPKGLRFDENGMVVLDNRHKEIPPVQWKHASVERFIWTACRGRFKGTHVPLSLDGRALVRMTPSSLSEGLCCGDLKAATELYNAIRDEVRRINESRKAF